MTTRTVYGKWFIEEVAMHHPTQPDITVFNVGTVVQFEDETRYKTSSEAGFDSFEKAESWVLKQPGAVLPEGR